MMADRQRVALTSGLQGVVGQTRPILGELAQGILHDHMDVLLDDSGSVNVML